VVLFGPDANLTPDRRRDSFKLACLLRPVPGPIRSLSLAAGPGPPWSDFLWPFPPGRRPNTRGRGPMPSAWEAGRIPSPAPSFWCRGTRCPGAPAAWRPAAHSCDRPYGSPRDWDSGQGLGQLPAGLVTQIGLDRVTARVGWYLWPALRAAAVLWPWPRTRTTACWTGDSDRPRSRDGPRRLVPVTGLTGCCGTVTLAEVSGDCLLGWRLGSAPIAWRPGWWPPAVSWPRQLRRVTPPPRPVCGPARFARSRRWRLRVVMR